jgi:hypothetical protein
MGAPEPSRNFASVGHRRFRQRRIADTAQKHVLTDAERAKRIRETAREIGADNDLKVLERFQKIVPPKRPAPRSSAWGVIRAAPFSQPSCLDTTSQKVARK